MRGDDTTPFRRKKSSLKLTVGMFDSKLGGKNSRYFNKLENLIERRKAA